MDYLENVDYNEVIEAITGKGNEWDIANGRHKCVDDKYLTKVCI